ncbi:hypothetical protein HN51_039898 [Arachis hypogaea]
MENLQYAEELVREFLIFRGFTNTLQSYDSELRTNLGKGFHIDKIIDLIFSLYVPKLQVDRIVALVSFLRSPKSTLLFSASTSFTPCNAHRIGLAGSVRFAVNGDGDVGLGGKVVDLVGEKKVEKEAGAKMVWWRKEREEELGLWLGGGFRRKG